MKGIVKFFNSPAWIGICLVGCIYFSKNISQEQFESLNDLITPGMAFFFGIQFVSRLIHSINKPRTIKGE